MRREKESGRLSDFILDPKFLKISAADFCAFERGAEGFSQSDGEPSAVAGFFEGLNAVGDLRGGGAFFCASLISDEIPPPRKETRKQCVRTTLWQLGTGPTRRRPRRCRRNEWRMHMKTYRLITLFAAVLITVSLTRVLSHERIGDLQARSPVVATANAP